MPITTGSESRRNSPETGEDRAPSFSRRGLFFDLFFRLRLSRVGDHLSELLHGENAGHAELADDERWRAVEAQSLGLFVVTRENGVDRRGIGGKGALGEIDIEAGAGQ